MPTFFLNTDSFKASNAFVATLNAAPGATYLAQINAIGLVPAANAMLNAMAETTAAGKASAIAANLGLTGAASTGAVSYLTSVTFAGASSTWGANLLQTLDLFTTLQSDSVYGTAATAYVARVNSAVAYSAVATNNSTDLTTLSTAIGSSGTTGAGSTLSLSTGIDTISGTGNNDSISGIFDVSASVSTANSGDTISGAAGTDTLSIRVTDAATGGTAGDTLSPLLSGIEVLSFDNDDTTANNAFTFNTGSVSGITNINSSGSSAGSFTTVSSVAAAAAIGMTSTRGTFAVDFATSVYASTTDSISISLNAAGDTASGGTAAKLIIDATGTAHQASPNDTMDSITIAVSGASRVDLAGGSAVKSLTISGSANLTLTDTEDSFGSVTAVSASSLTGNLDINLATNTRNVTVTTGSGNDRLNLGTIGTHVTADDTYDLGSGSDTVALAHTSFTASDITRIKAEFATAETIEITSSVGSAATGSFSMSAISIINTLSFSTSGTGTAGASGTGVVAGMALAITNIESGDGIVIGASKQITGGTGAIGEASGTSAGNGGVGITLTPDVDGGSDSVTITLSGGSTVNGGAGGAASASATGGTGGNAIVATSFEVVNIVSNGTSTNTIAGGVAASASGASAVAGVAGSSIVVNTNGTINVTGARALALGTIGGSNASVNAENFTAALTVNGEAGNNTIKGGSAADTIDGRAGIDTLTGNGGADIFNFRLGTGDTDSQSNAIAANTVGAGSAASTASTLLSVDSITDYTKGTDLISITVHGNTVVGGVIDTAVTMASTLAVTNSTASAGTAAINSSGIVTSFNDADDTLIERILAAQEGIETGTAAVGQFAIFEFSGSTYVFVSDGVDNLTDGDVVIKLTGVTGIASVGFSGGDIVLS